MKTKDLKNLRGKELIDLIKEAQELRKKISLSYLNIKVGKEKNLKAVKNQRQSLAQVLGIISEKKEK